MSLLRHDKRSTVKRISPRKLLFAVRRGTPSPPKIDAGFRSGHSTEVAGTEFLLIFQGLGRIGKSTEQDEDNPIFV